MPKVNQQWLIISLHDERHDFNLELRIFEGTVNDFEKSIFCDFTSNERNEWIDNAYYYHKENRSFEYPGYVEENIWDTLKDLVEIVHFETVLLIPLRNLNDPNFILYHPIINRQIKFGFLDFKVRC